MRRLLDGSTHCAGGCSAGAPVLGPENVFLKHTEKSELKELSECTFSLRQHFSVYIKVINIYTIKNQFML